MKFTLSDTDPQLLSQFANLLVNNLAKLTLFIHEQGLPLQDVVTMTRLNSLCITAKSRYAPTVEAGDTLALLQALPQLHMLHLMRLRQPSLDLGAMHALRKLSIEDCGSGVYDMATCTQITCLEVTLKYVGPNQVWLPSGSTVQLHHLTISSRDQLGDAYVDDIERVGRTFNVLQNLSDATQLTSIRFDQLYPCNLKQNWPTSLPNLEVIKMYGSPAIPPQEVVGYSLLRNLDLSGCFLDIDQAVALPDWLSQLTQLDHLNITGVWWSQFPLCLLQLRQLQSLSLSRSSVHNRLVMRSHNGPAETAEVDLPAEISQFSGFHGLTYLDLRLAFGTRIVYSERALRQLSQLTKCLPPGMIRY